MVRHRPLQRNYRAQKLPLASPRPPAHLPTCTPQSLARACISFVLRAPKPAHSPPPHGRCRWCHSKDSRARWNPPLECRWDALLARSRHRGSLGRGGRWEVLEDPDGNYFYRDCLRPADQPPDVRWEKPPDAIKVSKGQGGRPAQGQSRASESRVKVGEGCGVAVEQGSAHSQTLQPSFF